MQSRIALAVLLAGFAAGGLALSSRPTVAQSPPGGAGGTPTPALCYRVLKYVHMGPNVCEVSPNDNIWRATEITGELSNWAVWEWYDAEWNLLDVEEPENITLQTDWRFSPNYYAVVTNENLMPTKLLVLQDYVSPNVYDTIIDVEGHYMGMRSIGTIWVRE